MPTIETLNFTDSSDTPQIVNELTRLHDELGRIPSPFDMEALSPLDPDTVYETFGEWDLALHRAGLIEYGFVEDWDPTEMLLGVILEVAIEIDDTPTLEQVTERGPYARPTYEKRFGSWNNAVRAAGLQPNENPDEDDLLRELQRLHETLDKAGAPTCDDMRTHGKFAPQTYIRRFGSWNNAVREAGYTPNVVE